MQQAEYTAPLSLTNIVNDWATVHGERISIIVHAVLRLNGGVDKPLKDSRGIFLKIRPLEHVFDDPGMALGVGFMSKDENNELMRDLWQEPLKAARDAYTAHVTRTAPNPRFTGVIPVTFFIENTKVILHSRQALYCPKNHADDAPVDEGVAVAFDDLQALCARSIALGLILPNSANPVITCSHLLTQHVTYQTLTRSTNTSEVFLT
ncbi:hypothetical protein LXA43DRAFT_1094384 [Ganoderma leucocontextum]|nr:hypothetical protein LXA43DRAFT_1094384 [Ganoderma leucocontextum]